MMVRSAWPAQSMLSPSKPCRRRAQQATRRASNRLGKPATQAAGRQACKAMQSKRTIMDILCSEGWRLKMTTSPLTMCRSTLYPGCR